MIRQHPKSSRTDTRFPYTTLFRSDNVGAAHLIGQIAGAAMRHRHGAIGAEQQLPHRLADEDRAPDDDRILAAEVAEPVLQQQQRSEERRVGQECVSTCRTWWSTYHSTKNKYTTTNI